MTTQGEPPQEPRDEATILAELASLCGSAGYAHVIAFLCFRDNFVGIDDEIDPDELARIRSPNRLLRTEISTLIGLMVREGIDFSLPDIETRETQTVRTDHLLQELHDSMSNSIANLMLAEGSKATMVTGQVLREPVFYGPESAYIFQYRDFAGERYRRDDEWLLKNRRHSIADAQAVLVALFKTQDERVKSVLDDLRRKSPSEWTLLPAFVVDAQVVADYADIKLDVVEAVLESFALPATETNSEFRALGDFNATNAYPLIPHPDGGYILYQSYSLAESLYESPFYWMLNDSAHRNAADEHRGLFTEEFCASRLQSVFGADRVYSNVEIVDKGGNDAGEIDVLVVFADRAIVVQAKSKRMTIAARKGNDQRIQDDFGKSVIDAHEQAQSCAKLLTDEAYDLRLPCGTPINVPREYRETYTICVVSDHYPALALQAREFLRGASVGARTSPFVMDVFLLDVMAEMLTSPLYFLSYLSKRAEYGERFLAMHEMAILGYHLRHNLWIQGPMNLMSIGDEFSDELDAAMLVRREGLPGRRTPEGILTRIRDTTLARIVESIETMEAPAAVALGFLLLSLSEEVFRKISDGIDQIVGRYRADGRHHDFTIGVGDSGLTVHCNTLPADVAMASLDTHCRRKKYESKAPRWFGISIDPARRTIRLASELRHPWAYSKEMEQELARSSRPLRSGTKVRRNAPCPCGSGKKSKKCCFRG